MRFKKLTKVGNAEEQWFYSLVRYHRVPSAHQAASRALEGLPTLTSLEVKINTWRRIFLTPPNSPQMKSFAVVSSVLRLTDKVWF